jgi:hypothetical protein
MTDIELINKILKAKKSSDLFSDNWKKEYFGFCNLIHPDHCKNPKASDAMARLSNFKDEITRGIVYMDDSGGFRYFEKQLIYEVTDKNRKLLKKSVDNYNIIKKKAIGKLKNFLKYMPESMVLTKETLTVKFLERTVSITGLKLDQIHSNWIFSRTFEFALFLQQIGYVHMGFNPETIFIVPETHGIICSSYYHMTPISKRAKTVSTRFKNWYPARLFKNKAATQDIDLELIKKIAIYLLGDISGAGTKLRRDKDINQEMLNFYLTKHDGTFYNYGQYRKLLSKNFERKFYPLSI